MRGLLFLLACVAISFFSAGCCFTKGLLGMDAYSVCVKADEDANGGGPTSLLLVWPEPEFVVEVSELKDLWEAKNWVEEKQALGICRSAFLGSINVGEKKGFADMDLDGKPLRMQCGASHLFIFTTVQLASPTPDSDVPPRVTRRLNINEPGSPFSGFLEITIQRDNIETRNMQSSAEFEYYCR